LAPGAPLASAGGGHTCAAKADGTLRCWGANPYGQLGSPTVGTISVPVQVAPSLIGATVALVCAGGTHTCARDTDSSLWCWGGNQYGQLGAPMSANSTVPVQVAPSYP
jgi:alpha-tubulin suppressor-like RCC1 family protein